jgi:long-chain acyl-CoA synthetase
VWTTAGKLKIVDRKKNIFKLSQGEYVAAEKIENIYGNSSLVMMSFVYGDSLQSCLVAIVSRTTFFLSKALSPQPPPHSHTPHFPVLRTHCSPLPSPQVVPDPDALALWASKKENGVPAGLTYKQLCADPTVIAGVRADMDRVAKAAKLKGFEMAKAIHLETEPFDVARGLLTPTFKLKRAPARDFFRPIIDHLYTLTNIKAPIASKM